MATKRRIRLKLRTTVAEAEALLATQKPESILEEKTPTKSGPARPEIPRCAKCKSWDADTEVFGHGYCTLRRENRHAASACGAYIARKQPTDCRFCGHWRAPYSTGKDGRVYGHCFQYGQARHSGRTTPPCPGFARGWSVSIPAASESNA